MAKLVEARNQLREKIDDLEDLLRKQKKEKEAWDAQQKKLRSWESWWKRVNFSAPPGFLKKLKELRWRCIGKRVRGMPFKTANDKLPMR